MPNTLILNQYGINKLGQRQGGFTLVEILIVVAIIGLLAAIALPQFSLYRQRSFDIAALSDIKNLQKYQELLMSNRSSYGISTNTGAAVVALGPGTILQGASTNNDGLAETQRFLSIGISSGVQLLSNTDVNGISYVLLVKHIGGTRIYGKDSDASEGFFLMNLPGTTLTASGINIASVPGTLGLTVGLGWTPL